MKIRNNAHLSYCTNIHSGETWEEVFTNLKRYTLDVKSKMAEGKPFGIGLRLSNESALALQQEENLTVFQHWLTENDVYVFTINGFPYGNFHNEEVKDRVHSPDWLSQERVDYTRLLFDLLAQLVPKEIDGGISTSPLSYKYWFANEAEREDAKRKSCLHMIDIVTHLIGLKQTTGKKMHLDIEPEPDGLLENTDDFIDFFQNYLLKEGANELVKKIKCSGAEARNYIREHIQLCYDVCHFAVAFEKPEDVIRIMELNRIKIGKIQISAALKCTIASASDKEALSGRLQQFDEPIYLHQAVIRTKSGALLKFPDLKQGITNMMECDSEELRTHFHVPIFLSDYQGLLSTQEDIIKALQLWSKKPYSTHLEVETYTWDVLPSQLQMHLTDAIHRELSWVQMQLEKEHSTVTKAVKNAANSSHKHSRAYVRFTR